MTLRTKFTETFGVEHPVVQGPTCSSRRKKRRFPVRGIDQHEINERAHMGNCAGERAPLGACLL